VPLSGIDAMKCAAVGAAYEEQPEQHAGGDREDWQQLPAGLVQLWSLLRSAEPLTI